MLLPLPKSATVACYVVRHGQTVLNKDKCFRGNSNPPLDSTGLKQAHEIADLLEPLDVSSIFCSDKQRATKTADIIAEKKNLPIHTSESLRALNVGDFSGQKRTPESESCLQSYLDDPQTQIPGGESLAEFKSRIHPCLQDAIELFCECGCPPVLVAHSSVVHEIGSILYGDHKSILVEPGGAVAVYFDGSKLAAKPIYKPLKSSGSHAETIT
jgi:broad specificity phosphatase PhoE